jgi:ADP-heptose:LPS heptosyltransferase
MSRPLVMRCGAFGDIVLLTALIHLLQLRFGTLVDVIVSGTWSVPLLTGQPGVGEVFCLRSRRTPFWLSVRQHQLVRWLRQRAPGPVWYCDSGAGRQLLGRAGIADTHICDATLLGTIANEHMVERWARFSACTPFAYVGRVPDAQPGAMSDARLIVSSDARDDCRRWLSSKGLGDKKIILIQAGNKRTMRRLARRRRTNSKYWPEDNWADVLRALHRLHPNHVFLMLGVQAESTLNCDILRRAALPRAVNCAGGLPVEVLLPLLECATGLVSVDTGPAHAAAALGCPTVVLFGCADPNLYRSGGLHTPVVSLVGHIDGEHSIRGISTAAVIDAWIQLMAKAGEAMLLPRTLNQSFSAVPFIA